MGFLSRKKVGGFADVIRCDQDNYLVWKWHPNAMAEGELKRETAIRTSSVLRVKNGEVAVFVYKKDNGELEDYIVGPHDETLKTKNFPVLSSIIGLWYEGDTPFQAEVFFINLAGTIQVRFGVPFFNATDYRFDDFEVPVAARGVITFKIEDYKHFVKLHRLVTFSSSDFQNQISSTTIRIVKDVISKVSKEKQLPLIRIESETDSISKSALEVLKPKLEELYGINVLNVDVTAIEIDKSSTAYEELKQVTKDVTKRQVEANVHDYEERIRIQREEGQYAQRMDIRQSHIGAYQTEVKGQVGVASAEALGKMGENGAGNVDMGGDVPKGGFNPMTIAAGIAVGSAIAKNLGNTLDGAMNGNNQTPPPVLTVSYFLAVDNKPTGPYDKETIKTLIREGKIYKDSLLWKEGTPTWEKASSFDEFKIVFPPEL